MSSEVARIRETIANEYLAAKWGLEGLAYGTARHPFISARMERIEEGHRQLQTLVGDQAIVLIAETLEHLPEKPTRYHLQRVLRHALGPSEETEHLLDSIQDAWKTLDLLTERLGRENALKIITTTPGITEVIPS